MKLELSEPVISKTLDTCENLEEVTDTSGEASTSYPGNTVALKPTICQHAADEIDSSSEIKQSLKQRRKISKDFKSANNELSSKKFSLPDKSSPTKNTQSKSDKFNSTISCLSPSRNIDTVEVNFDVDFDNDFIEVRSPEAENVNYVTNNTNTGETDDIVICDERRSVIDLANEETTDNQNDDISWYEVGGVSCNLCSQTFKTVS